jgi:hypothetical protein
VLREFKKALKIKEVSEFRSVSVILIANKSFLKTVIFHKFCVLIEQSSYDDKKTSIFYFGSEVRLEIYTLKIKKIKFCESDFVPRPLTKVFSFHRDTNLIHVAVFWIIICSGRFFGS